MSEVQLRWVPSNTPDQDNATFVSMRGQYTDGTPMKLQFRQREAVSALFQGFGGDANGGKFDDWEDVPVEMNP